MAGPWEKYAQPHQAGSVFTLPKAPDPDAAISHQMKVLQLQKAMKDATKEQVGDAQVESLAKLYAANKLVPPTRPNEVAQKAIARAMELDPNYDPELAANRAKAIKDFSGNGQAAQVVRSVNRLASHLNDMYQASEKMGGPNLGVRVLNKMVASVEQQGEPELVAKFDAAKPFVAAELDKITKGTGQTTVSGISEAIASLDRARSLDERRAAFKQIGALVHGALDPIKQSWNSAYGGDKAPPMWVSPAAAKVFGGIDPDNADTFGGNDWRGLPGLKGVGDQPTLPPSDADVQAEVKTRIAHGEDPATTIQWLTTIGRPPSKETIAEILANKGNQNPDVRPPAQAGGYADSYLGQGLSGANEGLASVLGAPADLARSAINLVPEGINAVANTNIPTLPEAIGGGQWWKNRLSDIGSVGPASEDPSKQFVRRVGQSVGAAAVPAGLSGSAAKALAGLLSGVGGGIGAATAQQVAPGNPIAEMAGDMVGGGLTGLGLVKAAQRTAQRNITSAVPTIDELKSQASNLYSAAEHRGVTATPEQTQQLAEDFRKTLLDEGQLGPSGKITNADTNTSKAFNLIEQYAGKPMGPKEMNTVRTVLSDSRRSADPSDQRLGHILLNQFDEFVSPLAPEFRQARSTSARYLQAQDLEKARELAGARASQFTGSGFENALRTEYRGLDRNAIKGNNYFSPDTMDAIQKVARGTPASNLMRGLGRLAPTGPMSGMGSIVPGMAVGAMTDPATGGMVGTGLAGAGIFGRIAATRMGIKAADNAELVARNGGRLDQAPLMPDSLKNYAALLAAMQLTKYGSK